MLQGEKVTLRPVRRSDITPALKWFNDPEVIQNLTMYLPMTEMMEEQYIENLGTARVGTTTMFMIEVETADGPKPIGSMGLEDINHKDRNAEFGIAIGEKDYWSKGYGTEAAGLIIRYGFEQLNLHRINSFVFSFNERSLGLHRKVGFTEEGRQRERIFKNGAYHDYVLFGLLRKDWLKLQTNTAK